MPQGQPVTVPDDGLTTTGAPQRPAARRPHRPRQGQVDRGVRHGAARLEPGLRRRGVPVRQEREVEGGRGGGLSRTRPRCTTSTASAAPSSGTRWASGWSWSRKPGAEVDHAAAAADGWAEIARRLAEERHDFYVLDEFTYPLKWGWVDVDEVVETLVGRPGTQHVVITGRDAPQRCSTPPTW